MTDTSIRTICVRCPYCGKATLISAYGMERYSCGYAVGVCGNCLQVIRIEKVYCW